MLGGLLASIAYKYVFDPYRGKPSTLEAANTMRTYIFASDLTDQSL